MTKTLPTHPRIPILGNLWLFRSEMTGPQHPCNGYLLIRDTDVILIDPPEDLTPDVVKEIAPGKPVSRIFLTHVQAEHGAGIFHYPHALIHVPEEAEHLCQGVAHYESLVAPWEAPWDWATRGNYCGHLAGARNERPLARPVSLAEKLQAGHFFQGFEIIPTPGHGKEAVTLVTEVAGRKVAFCGDLIYGKGKLWNWFDCDWDYGSETGQRSLLHSAHRMIAVKPDLLCPSHGLIIQQPEEALQSLCSNLERTLTPRETKASLIINFPDMDSPAPGFRRLTQHLHQWKTGNTVILTSDRGRALVIDDGLCIWKPVPERLAEHDAVFRNFKNTVGIRHIDYIIPTHYHGDHTEFIPRLARQEGAKVIALDSMVGPMEHPERYNLACVLPWYDTDSKIIPIDKKVPEGYVLEWEGYSLEFFHLGGQTRYHLGLRSQIDGLNVLFAGDAWYGTATEACPVLCWNESEPLTHGWVFALDRMIEREPDLLVCGHGSAVLTPLPYLRQARQAWDVRLAHFATLNPHPNSELFFSPFFS